MAYVFLEFTDARRKIDVEVYNTLKVITFVKQKICISSG